MTKAVRSARAPAPVGPYSQATEAGGFLFVSAQLGLDPATGAMEVGLEAQAARAISNVSAVLEECGLGWGSVVKVTLYLTDMASFSKVNEVYGRALGGSAPARSTLGVASLPRGGLIAVDAVASLS